MSMPGLWADGWFYVSSAGLLVSGVLFFFLLGQYRAAADAADEEDVDDAELTIHPVLSPEPGLAAPKLVASLPPEPKTEPKPEPKTEPKPEPKPAAEKTLVMEAPKPVPMPQIPVSEKPAPAPAPAPAPVPAPKPVPAEPAPAMAAPPAAARAIPPASATGTGGISPAVVYLQNIKNQLDELRSETKELAKRVDSVSGRDEALIEKLSELAKAVELLPQLAKAIEGLKSAAAAAPAPAAAPAAEPAPAPAPKKRKPEPAPEPAILETPEAKPEPKSEPKPEPKSAAEPKIELGPAPGVGPAVKLEPAAKAPEKGAKDSPEAIKVELGNVLEPPPGKSGKPPEPPPEKPAEKPAEGGDPPAGDKAKRGPVWPV